MGYASVFDFLKEDDGFNDIYRDCLSMERQMIFESFDMSYVKGRTICEKLIKKIAKNNSKVSYLFSRKKDNGQPYIPGLSEMLKACKNKQIISKNISNKYYKIKKVGDAGAHGEIIDEYNIKYSKKVHKMVFDITIDCYNEFNYPKKVSYYYGLDESNKIENTSDDRQEELNNLHMTEVAPENTIEYYNFKKIFLTMDSFKNCISKYEDEFSEKNEFLNDLEKYTSINDENIDDILSNVESGLRTKIKTDVEKLSQEKSEKIVETLNDLSEDLTFEEINEMIDSAEDDDKREIYSFIKELSTDIARKYLIRNKEELEKVPITFIDENGRKVSKREKYGIEEGKNGCCLKICLDKEQKSAVKYKGTKPLVINAGPGSGKTRILVERVVYLIKKFRMDPSTILVITFTNKSAQELRNRLINDTDLSIDIVNEIRIDTIHGFCIYLMDTFENIPYNYFNGYHEQFLFFSNFKKELGFTNYAFLHDGWIPRVLELYSQFFYYNVDIGGLIDYINSKLYNFPMKVSSYRRYINDFHKQYEDNQFPNFYSLKKHGFMSVYYYHVFLNIAYSYPQYKQLLETYKIYDFDHLIEKAYQILKKEHNIHYHNVLIDEFQDIDFNQMKIFKILQEICVKNSGTFTIVGDSDQSIYGWRGSSPLFFENCVGDPNFQLVTIHNNYRSSGNIVEFNEELIKNYRSIEKGSNSVKSEGNPVFYLSSLQNDEAKNVIQILKGLKTDNKIKYYSDVALLFRTNRDIERFIEVFEEYDLPYYSLTKKRDFLNQNEVKSMLTLFWLLMPYHKNKFVYRCDDFLNLSWLSDDYFGLSKQTQDILNKIQSNFEESAIRLAREASFMNGKVLRIKKYSSIFKQDEEIINYVFDNIETFDLLSLDMHGLIELGIDDIKDLEFFSKLKNLKLLMWDNDLSDSEKPDSLDIFNSLLNITDYFKEVSIRNDKNSIRVKYNLALFSQIIYDYQKLIGSKDYLGLFNYLNTILESCDCHSRDTNERFDKVHLMTMHMAKGLEYPVVILCSLMEERFSKRFVNHNVFKIPDYLMGNKLPSVEKQYNEEMKLIYVATTRARDLLILSSINKNDKLPAFLESLANSDVKIKSLQPYNLNQVQKISSSIINGAENVKTLNFEEILSDYLFCPFRYDIFNNTQFSVSMYNQKSVESILHDLIYRVHNNYNQTDMMSLLMHACPYFIPHETWHKMIDNVDTYWKEYGKTYDVIKSNVFLRKQMINCEINCTADLIVKEGDNEISLVQFIGSDNKINSFIDEYMDYLHFYTSIIKASDEFRGYKFKNIILHSIGNNKLHCIPYQSKIEENALNNLEGIVTNIVEEKFDKKIYRCVDCECNGNFC